MRVSILKRMESSINSFGLTISKILKEVDFLIDKIDKNQFNYDTSLSIIDVNLEDDEIEEMIIGNKVKVLLQDMDLIKLKQDLVEDSDNGFKNDSVKTNLIQILKRNNIEEIMSV